MTEEEQLLEEERLRREQESYPVARAPVWAGSAPADIDAANAAEPMQRSYVEPGQEARGFIAADVGPTGNVISGSYDSAPDDLRALQAHEAAIRYKGMQTYRSLLQGGATPAEAYRLAGADLNFSNPERGLRLDALMQRNKPMPLETITRDGRTFYRTGPNSFRETAHQKPAPMVKGSVPADVKQQDSMLAKTIDSKRTELTRGFKYSDDGFGEIKRLPYTAEEKAAMETAISELEKQRKQLMAPRGHLKEEFNPNIDQTGWAQMKERWENGPRAAPVPEVTSPPDAAPSPYKEGEAIRNKRNGKLYRVVNGVPVEVKE